jgi:CheY-like chemotaxis protein
MAAYYAAPRALVVDDAADIRAVIRRVLTSRGYRVDAAMTLAQARAMAPSGYDVVLIDMHLGPERGSTLLKELTAADPEFARRCLMMSGNRDGIPSGVATLTKPFLPDELLRAVRALRAAPPEAAAGGGADGERGAPAPAVTTTREPGTADWPAQALLNLVAMLRERERSAFADALHDDSVQDLGAAVLGLHLVREQLPAGQRELLDSVNRQVSEAAVSLRGLIGQYSTGWPGEPPPAETITERTAWLLVAPPDVTIRSCASGMSPQTARFVASVAELVLFLASGPGPPRARIRVRDTARTIDIEITMTWAPDDPRPDEADAARGERLLTELGYALGSDIDLALDQGKRQLCVSLRWMTGVSPEAGDVRAQIASRPPVTLGMCLNPIGETRGGRLRVARILVVDDEPDQRALLRRIFERVGHEVWEAGNGAAALEVAHAFAPDLVVTDMMMPVMGGPELIRRLRADPVTAAIPILVASGDVQLAGSADAVIRKPYSSHKLIEAADSLIDHGSDLQ